jgi:hypothetical protein
MRRGTTIAVVAWRPAGASRQPHSATVTRARTTDANARSAWLTAAMGNTSDTSRSSTTTFGIA